MAGVRYDLEADVLYVTLNEGTIKTQTFLDDLRIIDYSEVGTVVGIEFIGASDGVDLRDVPFARTVEKLIGESGLPLKTFA